MDESEKGQVATEKASLSKERRVILNSKGVGYRVNKLLVVGEIKRATEESSNCMVRGGAVIHSPSNLWSYCIFKLHARNGEVMKWFS